MRGRYRILLGMAAGVGKTYRMLQEGRQALEEGRDVVIGYLEPHDRPETSVLAEGLEVVNALAVAVGDPFERDGLALGDGALTPPPQAASTTLTASSHPFIARNASGSRPPSPARPRRERVARVRVRRRRGPPRSPPSPRRLAARAGPVRSR